ncbi:MAG: IS110 family transposase [Dehalococcoidia bacterium]|nr:IS110 family transposase [Dehalococcoidia bacterium]
MISQSGVPVSGIIVGVDTHKDEHVAVAITKLGARIGQRNVPTTMVGYMSLEGWANSLGEIDAFGIEGTGSYGAGLSRFLSDRGHRIIEVNRPDRSTRRRIGKSDPTDAEMAARAVLAGVAREEPKSGVDTVEMIRMIKSAKDSAMKARTQSINQMKALVFTSPVELRSALRDLTASQLIARCARWRPGKLLTVPSAAKYTLWSLARRHIQLTREIEALDVHLARLTAVFAPGLTQSFGIGPDTAAALLITAGSNPERLKSEASFAALCGVNPIPASSGKTNRHRLNRGGDRRANAAIHRIVIVRLRYDERTKAYLKRRTEEGKTKTEVIRCLKRYVSREVFAILHGLIKPNIVQCV